MAALAQDGALNEELLSGQELDASYGPLRQQVRDSIDRQESVMANVQVGKPLLYFLRKEI